MVELCAILRSRASRHLWLDAMAGKHGTATQTGRFAAGFGTTAGRFGACPTGFGHTNFTRIKPLRSGGNEVAASSGRARKLHAEDRHAGLHRSASASVAAAEGLSIVVDTGQWFRPNAIRQLQ